jgi:hypothetical protein
MRKRGFVVQYLKDGVPYILGPVVFADDYNAEQAAKERFGDNVPGKQTWWTTGVALDFSDVKLIHPDYVS